MRDYVLLDRRLRKLRAAEAKATEAKRGPITRQLNTLQSERVRIHRAMHRGASAPVEVKTNEGGESTWEPLVLPSFGNESWSQHRAVIDKNSKRRGTKGGPQEVG